MHASCEDARPRVSRGSRCLWCSRTSSSRRIPSKPCCCFLRGERRNPRLLPHRTATSVRLVPLAALSCRRMKRGVRIPGSRGPEARTQKDHAPGDSTPFPLIQWEKGRSTCRFWTLVHVKVETRVEIKRRNQPRLDTRRPNVTHIQITVRQSNAIPPTRSKRVVHVGDKAQDRSRSQTK